MLELIEAIPWTNILTFNMASNKMFREKIKW